MKYQKGFINVTTADLVAGLAMLAAFFISIGLAIGWAAPIVWGWIKPWIHMVTA